MQAIPVSIQSNAREKKTTSILGHQAQLIDSS